jgi:hypothetical protein
MQLKFYLNKFLKVDNIEYYTLGTLKELQKVYDEFKESSEGIDPDFPGINFGNKGKSSEGKLKTGNNIYKLMEEDKVSKELKDDIDFTLTKK